MFARWNAALRRAIVAARIGALMSKDESRNQGMSRSAFKRRLPTPVRLVAPHPEFPPKTSYLELRMLMFR